MEKATLVKSLERLEKQLLVVIQYVKEKDTIIPGITVIPKSLRHIADELDNLVEDHVDG